jgi:hypothetical protein
MSDNTLYRDVRGLCRRDYCHEDAERFGLCAKQRRLRVRMQSDDRRTFPGLQSQGFRAP